MDKEEQQISGIESMNAKASRVSVLCLQCHFPYNLSIGGKHWILAPIAWCDSDYDNGLNADAGKVRIIPVMIARLMMHQLDLAAS